MAWKILNLLIGVPFKKLFIKEIKGKENIPKNPPFIVASNHASYMDIVFICKIMLDKFNKKTHYVSHPGIYGRKLPNFVYVDYAGCIPLDVPKEEFFSNVKEKLKNKKIVAIFPEGYYTSDGKIKKFKIGVGRMVLESKVPVLPVAIRGTHYICPGVKLIPKFKKIVRVIIGKPMTFNKYYNVKPVQTAYENIASEVEAEVKKLFKT